MGSGEKGPDTFLLLKDGINLLRKFGVREDALTPVSGWFIALLPDDEYGVKYSLVWNNDHIVQTFRIITSAQRPCIDSELLV